MAEKLPRWAKRLMDKYPDAERPNPENPLPSWLEEELRKVPLWYQIREATDDPRFAPPFHLIEDVRRQPDLLRQTLDLRNQLSNYADRIVSEGYEHLVFIGCGSAFYTSLFSAFLFRRVTGLTTEGLEAWEFRNYWQPQNRKTLVIAQSATGGSFEVLEAVRLAQSELGLKTLAITNTFDSPLEAIVDETIVFPTGQKTGPDICVITTRLMLLCLLAFELGLRTRFNLPVLEQLNTQLANVPENVERFLKEQDETVHRLAEKHRSQSCLFVVGGGPNWFTALEVALKVEEESRTPCRTYQTADYPHMAISLLASDRTTMVIAPPGPSYERLHDCVRTAKVAGSPTIGIVVEGDKQIARDAEDIIALPAVDEMLFPILGTVFGQLFGYYLGVAKGVNPDTLGTDQLSHAKAWLTAFPLGKH
ncbi:MAG: SIS domain-containing protein [Armatimonadetes bacterium]|nr:SIS domain-containing protein [Armatimonadota bacterium]MDW8028263.1 SIS domain-containing protein [Armatimonadota bacterium]